MKVGQLIKLAVLGFFFFLFVAVDLVLFGVIPLNSPVVSLLPLIGLLLCAVLGMLAARGAPAAAPAAPAAAAPPAQGGQLPPPPPA
jgi:hypothetical protein